MGKFLNTNFDLTSNDYIAGIVGRRGLVGLFVMYESHGAKGGWFESRPLHLFSQ